MVPSKAETPSAQLSSDSVRMLGSWMLGCIAFNKSIQLFFSVASGVLFFAAADSAVVSVTFCRIFRPTLNFTTRFAGTWTFSSVRGFCALRAARTTSLKLPNPCRMSRLPNASSSMMRSKKF